MLRRRRDAQAQASGQAEGRQEAHAPVAKVDIPQEAFVAALKVDVSYGFRLVHRHSGAERSEEPGIHNHRL